MSRNILPQDYIRNAGTLIDDFEDVSSFTGTGSTILSADTSHVRFGTYSLKIKGEANKVINIKINPKIFSFYVYIESPKPSTLTVMISSTTNFSKYFHYSVSGALRYGWNRIMIKAVDWNNSGGESWDNTMIRYKIRISPQAESYANIYVDEMRINDEAHPKCVITFDDNIDTVYANGYSYMSSRGLRGTMYTIPSLVGAHGYLTLEQLQEMYADGWAIANHTYNHTSNSATIATQLTMAADWLINNGMGRAAYHGAYPGGAYNDATLAAVQDAGMLTMRSLVQAIQPTPVDDYHVIRGEMLPFNMSLATAKGKVDRAIEQGGTVILVFHQIVETANFDTQWSIANFQALMDYIVERKIDVVTIDEWYEGLTNPRYRSLPLSRTTV